MSIASRIPFLFGDEAKLSSRSVIYLEYLSLSLSLLTTKNKIGHRRYTCHDRIDPDSRTHGEHETRNVKRRTIHRSRGRSPSRLLVVCWCNKREITLKLRANYKKCVCKRTNLRKWLDGSLNSLLQFLLFGNTNPFLYENVSIKRVLFRWDDNIQKRD